MVDFRRWFIALAIVALFVSLAGAQSQVTCNTNVTSTPTLRAEGYTENTGDITITCTGGNALSAGPPAQQIPQVNITVFLNTAVTSRLFSSSAPFLSEALLLIDEPGANLNGYGNPSTAVAPLVPNTQSFAPQVLCTTPLIGCIEYATGTAAGGNLGAGAALCVTYAVGTTGCTGTSTAAVPNVFQGVVSGNSVTFFGVPIQPPGTTTSRVIRITNIRANATALSGGSAAGATPVIASIASSNTAVLPISTPSPTVGFVQAGLTTAAGSGSFNQCSSSTKSSVGTLTFTELFATAFKTRVAAQTNVTYAGQGFPLANNQNVPGTVYNSESNFVYGISGTQTAGLSDYGTRLKATFNNVPSGVRLFVSVGNVLNSAVASAIPAVIGGSVANQSITQGYIGYAQLISSENVGDGNTSLGLPGAVTSTDFATTNGNTTTGGNIPIAEIPIVNGSGTAVWEVINTNPNFTEKFMFQVFTTYSSNTSSNSPPPGQATVNMSYAPTPPLFSASSGAAASATLTIPRFTPDPNAAKNLLLINLCRTILLYPYVTNAPGFDTGIAVANTSTDPFGTTPQSGTCTLKWYTGTSNPADTAVPSVASGTVYANLVSAAAPNFTGYMIAICNFQFAHGFAFISDPGTRNFAMGYLAVVLPDPLSNGGSRNPSSTGCGATAGSSNGVSCGTGEEGGR